MLAQSREHTQPKVIESSRGLPKPAPTFTLANSVEQLVGSCGMEPEVLRTQHLHCVCVSGGYFWLGPAHISSWGTTVCSQGEGFSPVSSTGIKLLHTGKAPWCELKCSNRGQAGDSLQKYHSNLNKNADLAYTGSLNEIQLLKSIVLLGKVTGHKLNTVLWGCINAVTYAFCT